MDEYKILQIIAPTVPVNAIYKNDDGPDFKSPVELWAVAEDKQGERVVIGLASEGNNFMTEIESAQNFRSYELATPGKD